MKTFMKIGMVFYIFFQLWFFTYGQGLRAGVSGGLNLGKHSEEMKHEEFRFRPAFTGGLFLAYEFNSWLILQSEFFYSMKGNVRVTSIPFTGNSTGRESKVITKLNYFEIPLLIVTKFNLDFPLKPKIMIGPAFSFLLTAKAEAEWPFSSNNMEIDQKDFWKPSEFGIILGFGGDYKFGIHMIDLSFRYNLGLNDINNGVGGGKITSNTFAFLLGYSIIL